MHSRMFLCFYVCVCASESQSQRLKGDTITFLFVMETSLGINITLLGKEQSNK